MGLSMTKRVTVVLIALSVLVSNLALAMRPINEAEDVWRRKMEIKYKPLLASSLQRGPVPPSGPSPCTYIPGQGSGSCPTATGTLNGRNFAGHNLPTRKTTRTSVAKTHVEAQHHHHHHNQAQAAENGVDVADLTSSFRWLTNLF